MQRIPRGASFASYAQGFNLTLPNEFQPSHAQWKMIFLKVRDELKNILTVITLAFMQIFIMSQRK